MNISFSKKISGPAPKISGGPSLLGENLKEQEHKHFPWLNFKRLFKIIKGSAVVQGSLQGYFHQMAQELVAMRHIS